MSPQRDHTPIPRILVYVTLQILVYVTWQRELRLLISLKISFSWIIQLGLLSSPGSLKVKEGGKRGVRKADNASFKDLKLEEDLKSGLQQPPEAGKRQGNGSPSLQKEIQSRPHLNYSSVRSVPHF